MYFAISFPNSFSFFFGILFGIEFGFSSANGLDIAIFCVLADKKSTVSVVKAFIIFLYKPLCCKSFFITLAELYKPNKLSLYRISVEKNPIGCELISGITNILVFNLCKISLSEISSAPKLYLVKLHKNSCFLLFKLSKE